MADYDTAVDGGESRDGAQPDSPREDTFFLKPDLIPGAENFAKGDSITFKVVGVNDDGELELEIGGESEPADEEMSMEDEMKEAVPPDRRTAALIAEEGQF